MKKDSTRLMALILAIVLGGSTVIATLIYIASTLSGT